MAHDGGQTSRWDAGLEGGGRLEWKAGCVVVERDTQGGEVVHGFRRDKKDFIDRVKFFRKLKSHRTMCDQRRGFVGLPNQPKIRPGTDSLFNRSTLKKTNKKLHIKVFRPVILGKYRIAPCWNRQELSFKIGANIHYKRHFSNISTNIYLDCVFWYYSLGRMGASLLF